MCRKNKNYKFSNIKNFGYEILKTLPLQEGISFIRMLPKKHSLKKGFSRKHTIAELAAINPTCVCCGVVGTKFCLGKDGGGGLHWDLYADDDTALSVDHIVPKVCGGKDCLENFQVMCSRCNTLKQHFPKRAEGFKLLLELLQDESKIRVKINNNPFICYGNWEPLPIYEQLKDYFVEKQVENEDATISFSYAFISQ